MQPVTIDAVRQLTETDTIATFVDTNSAARPQSFVAKIRWGDGKVSTGTVTETNGIFSVTGRHRYATAGRFTVKLSLTLSGSNPQTKALTSTANVFTSAAVRAARLAQLARRSTVVAHHASNRH
jgi:hypothetical protein